MSIYAMIFSVFPVAVTAIGALIDAFGAPATICGCGLILAGCIGAIAVLNPNYRRSN